MIVEQLFTTTTDVMVAETLSQASTRNLTPIEENAIYYIAGYVVKKVLCQYKKQSADVREELVKAALSLLGDIQSDTETHDSYLDYVKVWTTTTDRGGLKHVSDDTYQFFKALELISYDLLIKGTTKECAIDEMITNDNVLFHWDLVMFDFDTSVSNTLLRDIVTLWFTVRGFSITSKLFEEYKKATKSTVKGKKGLRKELH